MTLWDIDGCVLHLSINHFVLNLSMGSDSKFCLFHSMRRGHMFRVGACLSICWLLWQALLVEQQGWHGWPLIIPGTVASTMTNAGWLCLNEVPQMKFSSLHLNDGVALASSLFAHCTASGPPLSSLYIMESEHDHTHWHWRLSVCRLAFNIQNSMESRYALLASNVLILLTWNRGIIWLWLAHVTCWMLVINNMKRNALFLYLNKLELKMFK